MIRIFKQTQNIVSSDLSNLSFFLTGTLSCENISSCQMKKQFKRFYAIELFQSILLTLTVKTLHNLFPLPIKLVLLKLDMKSSHNIL